MKILPTVLLSLFLFSFSSVKSDNLADGSARFYSVSGIPVIEATINDKDAWMIIDSGASMSVLDLSKMNEFKFRATEDPNHVAAGFGGSAHFYQVSNASVKVGTVEADVDFKSQDLSEIARLLQENTGIRIDGVLGSDFLSQNKIIIDYSTNQIYLGSRAKVASKL